ncbi:glycosyltransferase family 9 protein [Pseudogulbenkiania ferrooxidans]|uniref:Glycosyl transferase family 9 n=1 Tax=Pseudogulbenkiania ferrooxidans 2002 TaxID=279714 RepID=B9YYP2_9NEIS|nr:glycosyltransferase family 9 protein [Pseudogulbenkiania ferrooxidans]EEG10245.1 glycosyl transferase family 9 [Pseudogulbenkiania ferrooxidans 2002]
MSAALYLPERPRLLVIIVARFGDTLLVTPTLAALKQRWPDAELTVLAHPGRMEVLEHLPFIDRLAPITKQRAFWRGRCPFRPRYDAAIVYGGDAALYRYARRVSRQVVAFAAEEAALTRCIDHAVTRPQEPMHAVDERALLLQPFGIVPASRHLSYQVSSREAAWAEQWMRQQGFAGRRLIGFQLQSFPAKAYRDWPVERFETLAKLLFERYPDVQLLLLGGPEGRAAAQALADKLGPRATCVAGTLTMRQNAALLSRLTLYVGVDTGPTHLAGALDVPMVAMYHCFHRGALLAPQEHPRLAVIEHPCPEGEVRREARMAEIALQPVLDAVCKQLDS